MTKITIIVQPVLDFWDIYKKKYLPISANPYCNFVILVPDISGSKPLLTHILAQL